MHMIISYYGGYVSISELSDMLNTDKSGTSAFSIIKVGETLGFKASGIKTNLDQINIENMILPCIAHVTIDNMYKHFIVIYEIDFKKRKLLIADPSNKITKISFGEFSNIWNNILLIFYPVKPIVKSYKASFPNFLIKNLFQHKKYILELGILSMFVMVFSIIVSFYFKSLFENIYLGTNILWFVFSTYVIINTLKIVTDYIRMKLLIFINSKVDISLNIDAYKKVLSLPYRYFRNRSTGEVTSKINDLEKIRNMINRFLLVLIFDFPLTVFSGIVLIFINWKLFIIAFLIWIFNMILALIFQKFISEKLDTCYMEKADMNSFMVESLTGIESIKGLGITKNIERKYEKKYIKYIKNVIKLDELLNMQTLMQDLISTIGEMIIIFVGCLLIYKNMGIGNLLAFNSIMAFFLFPIKNIVMSGIYYKEASIAYKKVYEIFKEDISKGIYNFRFDDVIIKNLNYEFNYDKPILKNINLYIKTGEKILITGMSGSGKSTLLKIIRGYYEVDRGQVFIGNIDINDFKNYENSVSYISQNEILFTDNLYNNINLLGKNEKEFQKVTQMCFIDEFVDNKLGYNMIIEENGFNISGGQKQRIILARTLLSSSNIILIDEGLSQIDINLERKILKQMFNYYNNKTIIIVSHRLENMDLFDRVLKIQDGRLVSDRERNE